MGTKAEGGLRLLLVEDHAVVRRGLRLVLEGAEGVHITGEAGDAAGAIEQARDLSPDVIVLDITMPGRSGIEALPELREAAPGAKILILSMQDEPAYVRRAFTAGANGYVLKEAGDKELIEAVHRVASGEEYVDATLGARLAAAEAQRQIADAELSEREREVARLLALGYTNQEVAKQLYVSVRTAEAHRAHIMRKLRLNTRAELVRWAFDHGLVESEVD